MYGLTRGLFTLLGVGAAGLLIWSSTQIDPDTTGDYWSAIGLLAAAGFVIALSQLLGGWTKWGWPRISGNVFLFAFLPTFVVVGWVFLWGQPERNWFERTTNDWSDGIGIEGVVGDLSLATSVLAFGLGLVLGLTLDTTGPRPPRVVRERSEPEPAARPADEAGRRIEIREGGTPVEPQPEPEPEPPPRTEEPPPRESSA